MSLPSIFAHEIRPAYLEINQLPDSSYRILWKVPTLMNRSPKITPVFPEGFEVEISGEELLPDSYIRRYEGSFSQALPGKELSIQGLEKTLIDALVHINLQDGISYSLLLQPDNPQVRIPVEPSSWEVAKLYSLLGIEHILIGIDHLLFVLGLLLLVPSIPKLVRTITAFTLAHSITLGVSSLDIFSLPQAPVEAVIALSILFLAREYISLKNGKESLTARYPWIVAFSFGLLHGFGFAGALAEIGLPQAEIPLALFTFNIGVELGQLFFIACIYLLLGIFKKLSLSFPSWSQKLFPYILGSIAAFWLIERTVGFWG